jgi:hypothetical protein
MKQGQGTPLHLVSLIVGEYFVNRLLCLWAREFPCLCCLLENFPAGVGNITAPRR